MRRWRAELTLALLLGVAPAAALDSDRRQPIVVQADSAELDNRLGTSTYRGNVVIDQGTLHIEAQLLILQREGDQLGRLEAEGQPVRFRQRPENAPQDIEGEARRMEYHAAEHRLLLTGAAEVRQGGDVFRGARIEYDTARGVVTAGSDNGAGGRVQAIIQPRDTAQTPAGAPEKQP